MLKIKYIALISVLGLQYFGAAYSAGVALREGVVVNAERNEAFVMLASGGLAAIDLVTGNVRWTTEAAVKPVDVDGERLLAQTHPRGPGQLAMAVLDVTTGEVSAEFSAALPGQFTARARDTLRERFRIQSDRGGVRWRYERRPGGGAQLPEEARALRVESGLVGIDLAAGTASTVNQPRPPAPAMDRLLSTPLPGVPGRQFYSENRGHVLASEKADRDARYRWRVFTDDGDPVGETFAALSYSPFVVVGSQLHFVAPETVIARGSQIVEQPLELRAIDLNSGRQAWAIAIDDPRYRGPYPP